MSMAIDHIVFCVDDLDGAADELQQAIGLESVAGGRHAGHGTANRIVPLGSAYLELVTVVDPDEAATSAFGTWVSSKPAGRLAPHALCLRTDDIDELCARLDIHPTSMSRTKPDGTVLRWRLAGVDAMVERGLPFFIEWDVEPADHPGAADIGVETSLEITLRGDADLLNRWVAGSEGISVEPGPPAVGPVTLHFAGRSSTL